MPKADGLPPTLSLVVLIVVLAVGPMALASLTAFAKISAVLHLTRSAIGVPAVPSNQIILALSLALTGIAMAPLGEHLLRVVEPVWASPNAAAGTKPTEAVVATLRAVQEPLRNFLEANASERERTRYLELARRAHPADAQGAVGARNLLVLAPAFIMTELLKALSLGVRIYLPFLVIDLLVANLLVSLGLQNLSPRELSLPLKLLLFVAVDGWGLLAEVLVTGYRMG